MLGPLKDCRLFPHRWDLIATAAKLASLRHPGSWAEFGVADGRSARRLLELMPAGRRLYLFDSWLGLPEDWSEFKQRTLPVGKFACPIPHFEDERVVVKQGWFTETLPGFDEPLALLHIDSDLESSADTILQHAKFGPGSVLLFDEFHGGARRLYGEARAWAKVEQAFEWEFIGRCDEWRAAVLILGWN